MIEWQDFTEGTFSIKTDFIRKRKIPNFFPRSEILFWKKLVTFDKFCSQNSRLAYFRFGKMFWHHSRQPSIKDQWQLEQSWKQPRMPQAHLIVGGTQELTLSRVKSPFLFQTNQMVGQLEKCSDEKGRLKQTHKSPHCTRKLSQPNLTLQSMFYEPLDQKCASRRRQWLWLSWQSGRFRYQRSAVRTPPPEMFFRQLHTKGKINDKRPVVATLKSAISSLFII